MNSLSKTLFVLGTIILGSAKTFADETIFTFVCNPEIIA